MWMLVDVGEVGLVPGEPLSPVSEWTSVKQDTGQQQESHQLAN